MSSTQEDRSVRLWYALDSIIASEAREAVEYALMEAGALGTETSNAVDQLLRVTAYFDHPPKLERVRAELSEALRLYDQPSSAVLEKNVREVPDEDWLGEWKKSWQPIEVGERFLIAPPWAEILDERERLVIRIEPGMAFGTGTHETTRLSLAAVEKYFAGDSFLDVGSGTGILAIAAAKLFPDARIEACDTDAEAIAITRENALLNGVSNQIAFRAGTIDDSTASADLVCANLTANAILDLLPSLLAVTCRRLIISGILDSQVEMMLTRLQALGVVTVSEVATDGEWVAIIV